MTIEMLDQGTILVSLGAEDLRLYSLRFDGALTAAVQDGLKDLLYRVGAVCGFDVGGKCYLVEALPAGGGCLLIITVRARKHRKKYRVKRARTREVCAFFDADAMLDYLRAAKSRGGCAVYRYAGRYYLLPAPSAPDSVMDGLGEYGELYPIGAVLYARIREHGRLLFQEEVQRRHIRGGAVAVGDAASGDRVG